MSDPHPLHPFFHPRGVAVVGASADPRKAGHALLRNLLFGGVPEGRDGERSGGFPGQVYAVNPRGGAILGLPVHRSLAEIEGPVDLVLVAIPPRFIPGLMDEVGAVGARAVIVISAGFAEMGAEGAALQEEVVGAARRHGIRVIGPNCLGILRPSARLNASFAASAPRDGRVGLLSQSGALVTGVISHAAQERFGLSAAVSLGAKSDVDDQDLLSWFAEDPGTASVAIYMEAVRDPQGFFESARSLARCKPVVVLKGGSTAAGARAASSHTGSLAGAAAAYRAAFAQAGFIQVDSIGDFIGAARALACQPAAAGPRLAIVTNAGGPGVLAADCASRLGLELATLSPETLRALDRVLPAVWSRNNPIDVIGDAPPERYRQALDVIGQAPEVDSIVLILTVQAMTDPITTAEAVVTAHENPAWSKPLCCSFMGLQGTPEGSALDARGVPEFNTPERAVRAVHSLVRRGAWLAREPAPELPLPRHPAPDLDRARALLAEAREAGQRHLDLARARAVLEAAGIRYNRSDVAEGAGAAADLAEGLGYPVVVKLISPDVVHKSDAGGVVLDVLDPAGVRRACASIRERVAAYQPGARITGFTVEEQVKGTEIIAGMSRDPDFGPLLMVGMGGVFVEVYKDVAFRLSPLSRRDALDMVGELRAQPLFDGARGRPRLNRSELAEVILRISALVEAAPEIAEIDVNPLVITAEGLVAIDARVVIADPDGRSGV